MSNVTIRELGRNPSAVVAKTLRSGRVTFVLRSGRPVAALLPLDPEAFEDYVLANAPEFVASMRQADKELRTGKTRSAEEVFAELEGRSSAKSAARVARRARSKATSPKRTAASKARAGKARRSH